MSNLCNDQRAAQEVADMDILRHMLGMGSHIKRKDWGFRNYFNAQPGHNDMPSLERLEARGLIEKFRPDYWRATEAGCKVAGLDAKAIRRAFSG